VLVGIPPIQHGPHTKRSLQQSFLFVIFEVSTAVIMKNIVFWDIETQFVPHKKHHVSATEPTRLMVCGETVAVCCENRTEHTDTLCGQSVPHRKHHVSAIEPTRLMVCGETVAVCCENRTEHSDTLWAVHTS
jgi:hypothetical protein